MYLATAKVSPHEIVKTNLNYYLIKTNLAKINLHEDIE